MCKQDFFNLAIVISFPRRNQFFQTRGFQNDPILCYVPCFDVTSNSLCLMRRATFKNTIILFVWPPKFCINIVFIFPWDHCKSQEKMKTIIAFLAAARKAWKFWPERGFQTWPLRCRCSTPSAELSGQLSKLNARFSVLLTLAVMLYYLSSSDKKAWIIQDSNPDTAMRWANTTTKRSLTIKLFPSATQMKFHLKCCNIRKVKSNNLKCFASRCLSPSFVLFFLWNFDGRRTRVSMRDSPVLAPFLSRPPWGLGPFSRKSRNFSGDKNPFVSSIGTHFVLWNFAVILPFLLSETY